MTRDEGRGRRVLLVEDNLIVQEMVRHSLEDHGYEVLTASDGPSGLAAGTGKGVDAVVLDLRIPGLDGGEVLRALKQERPSLPVFVFSARGDFADTVAGLPEADGCFAKSSDLGLLLEALGRALP